MKPNRTIALLCLLLLTIASSFAQERQPQFLQTIPIGSVTAISADRNGSVYLLNPRRNLVHLDSLGRLVTVYSPQTILSRNTTIDAGNPLKVLVFTPDRQELLLLDRFMRPISSANLSEFGMTETIRAAALASDDGFWLFNETDFALSKLDMRMRKVVFETPLSLVLDQSRFDVRMIREYQNQVYLLDYNGGIYVFDNLGNYKQRLPLTEVPFIGFLGNELYFVKEGNLHFYDLYKQQQRTINFPKEKKYTTALATKNRLYLFSRNSADVYSW